MSSSIDFIVLCCNKMSSAAQFSDCLLTLRCNIETSSGVYITFFANKLIKK